MSVAMIDSIYEGIVTATTKETLSKIKRVLDKYRDDNTVSPVVYRGLNQDIRDRADWMLAQRKGRK